jgi:membrane-associated phospholipid phosphatase
LYSYRWSIIFTTSVVLSNLAVFIGKHMIFYEAYRPSKYFELYEKYKLHLVQGVSLHSLHSFPSGHTTTAFTLFIMLAFLVRNNSLKFLCFIVALLTGYSRIYLSQHFLVDVLVGSVIGVTSVLITWHLLDGYNQSWFDDSLVSGIRKRRKKDVPVAVSE